MKREFFLFFVGVLLLILFVSLAAFYSCFVLPSIVLENNESMNIAKIRICYGV